MKIQLIVILLLSIFSLNAGYGQVVKIKKKNGKFGFKTQEKKSVSYVYDEAISNYDEFFCSPR